MKYIDGRLLKEMLISGANNIYNNQNSTNTPGYFININK